MRAIFDEAWRERQFTSPGRVNYLALARAYCERLFGESVKDFEKQRRAEGVVHAGFGYRRELEDMICTAFGAEWRLRRDRCDSYGSWKKRFDDLKALVCTQWKLPDRGQRAQGVNADVQAGFNKYRNNRHRSLGGCPEQRGDDPPVIEFHRTRNCFVFVVDCTHLAKVACGGVPLNAPGLTPVFEKAHWPEFSVTRCGMVSSV